MRHIAVTSKKIQGGVPEWHIQANVLPLLDGHCQFQTADGKNHVQEDCWDMVIAFPPCTHLAVSGARYFEKKYKDGRQLEGLWFFAQFLKADCERIAVENPVGIISGNYVGEHFRYQALKYGLPVKPTQIIQPYEYGHPVRKSTCLWLKGLPKLEPTNIVEFENIHSNGKSGGYSGNSWYVKDENGKILSWNDERTAKERSKTYRGIAEAMAEQWGDPEGYVPKAIRHEDVDLQGQMTLADFV